MYIYTTTVTENSLPSRSILLARVSPEKSFCSKNESKAQRSEDETLFLLVGSTGSLSKIRVPRGIIIDRLLSSRLKIGFRSISRSSDPSSLSSKVATVLI